MMTAEADGPFDNQGFLAWVFGGGILSPVILGPCLKAINRDLDAGAKIEGGLPVAGQHFLERGGCEHKVGDTELHLGVIQIKANSTRDFFDPCLQESNISGGQIALVAGHG